MEPREKSGKQKDQTAKKSGAASRPGASVRKTGQIENQGSANAQAQPGTNAQQSSRNPDRDRLDQGGKQDRKEGVMGLPDGGAGASDVDAQALPGTAIAENSDERHQKISVAAYARAERRGFEPGREEEDWLSAEAELYGDYTRDGEDDEDKREQRRHERQRDRNDSQ